MSAAMDQAAGSSHRPGRQDIAALMRAHDWAASPLGAPPDWPQSLRIAVDLMLAWPGPASILWGAGRIQLYNDPYVAIAAERHPAAFGQPAGANWIEAYPDLLGPIIDRVFAGEAVQLDEHAVSLRNPGGGLDTRFFTGSFLPIRDEAGGIAGVFHPLTDVTAKVRADAQLRESEARFRNMADHAPVITWVTDPSGYCTYLNRSWYEFTGQTAEEAEGFGWLEVTHPEDRAPAERIFLDANAARQPFRLEYRLRRSDGAWRWAIDAASPRFGADGAFLGFVGSVIDIDERRRAEARRGAVADLGDRLRGLREPADIAFAAAEVLGRALDTGRVGYAAIDHDQETLHVERDWTAPGVETLAGVLSLRAYGSFVESLKRDEFTIIRDVRADPRTADSAAALEVKGSRSFVNAPVVEHGRLVAVFFVNDPQVRDWTEDELALIREFAERTHTAVERARGEAALRDSEEQLRLATEAAEIGLWDLDVATGTLFWPPRLRAMFGITGDRPISMTDFSGGLHPDDRAGTEAAFAAALDPARRELYDVEYRTVGHEDGITRWVAAKGRGVFDETGRCVRVIGTAIDITARRGTEAALRDSEARLRELNDTLEAQVAARSAERDRLWNLSQDMLARADYTGMMSAVSPAWTRVLGWSEAELLSRGYATFMHPDDAMPTLEAIGRMNETRAPIRFENRIATRDGGWNPIEWTVAPEPDGVNFIAVGRDLSLNKAREAKLEVAQEALRQSQKMEAMGQLTGGVAHDFNNLLTPIVGVLDMLERKGLGTEREQRLVSGAVQSADRAKTLVQRLLAFARRQPLQPVAVDVGELVTGMGDLLASTTGPQIRLSVEAAEGLPPANADANQLEMALLNLGVNARDAMPEGGTLRITADEEAVGIGHRSKLPPGRYVRLSVADTGTGMDAATLARAVEPFFSTKGVGKGTGLGLSMVHGLASQLGGALAIQSRPGLGTNVELWLPASAASPSAAEGAGPAGAAPANGRGTVLLVDDERLVRTSIADMLEDLGYRVVEATSAEEALDHLAKGLTPALLVTDHLMPAMSGTDLARAVRAQRPGLPVLVISGFAEEQGIAAEFPRLSKPFRQSDLAARLEDLRRG